jgi:hypothetical protein
MATIKKYSSVCLADTLKRMLVLGFGSFFGQVEGGNVCSRNGETDEVNKLLSQNDIIYCQYFRRYKLCNFSSLLLLIGRQMFHWETSRMSGLGQHHLAGD